MKETGISQDCQPELTRFATGIVRTEERTPGIRYRYLGPESQNGQLQTRRLTETTSSLATRFTGINATLYGNGEVVAVNRLGNAEIRGGASYLGKDVLGSVRSRSNEDGQLEDRYEYDAFGKPYKGDLNSGMNLGYTGKPYDTATGMYNYGYRDYQPEVARFTTVDPIRDGANWFAYVNNDPVNWIDLWGLQDAMAIRQTLLGMALTGLTIPGPVAAAAIIITGVIIADQISGGKISQGIANVVDSLISLSAPVRDKEKNPIPAGNQPQSPTGKGANSGPMDIGDPGDLGGSGFKPPNPENPKDTLVAVTVIGVAGGAVINDMRTDVASSPPPDPNQSKDKNFTAQSYGEEPAFRAGKSTNEISQTLPAGQSENGKKGH